MAKNDYLSAYDRGSRDCVGATFSDVDKAEQVIQNLQQAGFSKDEIGFASASRSDAEDLRRTGVAASVEPVSTAGNSNFDSSSRAGDDSSTSGEHKGFWSRLFGGDDDTSDAPHPDRSELEQVLINLGFPKEEARYFEDRVEDGDVLVTVRCGNARAQEALQILHGGSADFGDRGYQNDYAASRSDLSESRPAAFNNRNTEFANTDRENLNKESTDWNEGRRIELRGEVLRAHKERVQRGEARIRKEVVTENRTIDVPVEREELVIERRDVQGERPASGDISADEIRVPLSEEQVRVNKDTVVTGEVNIGKRRVQDTRHIDADVRREEIRDQDTDINSKRDRKNIDEEAA